jgi:transcription elongation factor GreA
MTDTERVVLTKEGYEKLFEQLKHLKTKKRREVANQLEHARAFGDLRENAEYETAKEAKRQLEIRIHDLEQKLAHAKVVEVSDIPADKIYLGATVELKNLDSTETVRYTLVAQDEANFSEGKISVTSPIGKGLLGKAEKEKVEIQVPAGKLKFQVLKITR